MYVRTGVRSGAGKAYGRVTLRRVRVAKERFARGGGALPLSKVRRGERLELAFPLTGLGARQCARAAVRRGEGTLARVGVPQQSWVDPVLFEAGAATRSLLTPREVRKRASTHTQVRTDGGAGGRADRVRRTWRGLPTGSLRAGRLAGPHLKCDHRAAVTVCAHGSGGGSGGWWSITSCYVYIHMFTYSCDYIYTPALHL
jgi:hypothetical protein